MKTWTMEPRLNKNSSLWLAMIGDTGFWAKHREYLDTFLDDRCSCSPNVMCEFHQDESIFGTDKSGARTGLKNAPH
jgi:hypothetical protein